MPQVSRTRKIQEKVTTVSQDGEVTINLNLRITIDGESTLKLDATASPQLVVQHKVNEEEEERRKAPEIVPTELFAEGDELIENFGSKE